MEIKTSANTADRKEEIMSEPKSQEQISLEKDYEEYVKRITPTHNLFLQMLKAFITGGIICLIGQFANSVAAPAVEFKKEGQVFGIGCKIFTIAGPVILYGIFSSWVLGVIYWIGKMIGIF